MTGSDHGGQQQADCEQARRVDEFDHCKPLLVVDGRLGVSKSNPCEGSLSLNQLRSKHRAAPGMIDAWRRRDAFASRACETRATRQRQMLTALPVVHVIEDAGPSSLPR